LGGIFIYQYAYRAYQIPHHDSEYAGSLYRVSNGAYRMPLRDSRRNSHHSQRSLRRIMNASANSEDSLIPESQYSDVFHTNAGREVAHFQSQKSIEQMVAEKLDEEVERRVKIEIDKIMESQELNVTNTKKPKVNFHISDID